MNKLLFFLVIIFLYLALYTAANAQTMSNSKYIIQMGNFN